MQPYKSGTDSFLGSSSDKTNWNSVKRAIKQCWYKWTLAISANYLGLERKNIFGLPFYGSKGSSKTLQVEPVFVVSIKIFDSDQGLT